MKLKCFGTYTTNGTTSTITPVLRFNTAATSTIIATSEVSGTFISGAELFSWSMEFLMYILDATHIIIAESILLGENNLLQL
jgi:hypothetical protein